MEYFHVGFYCRTYKPPQISTKCDATEEEKKKNLIPLCPFARCSNNNIQAFDYAQKVNLNFGAQIFQSAEMSRNKVRFLRAFNLGNSRIFITKKLKRSAHERLKISNVRVVVV